MSQGVEIVCGESGCQKLSTKAIRGHLLCNTHYDLYGGDYQYDEIDKPKHYNSGKIEVWDFITDQDMCYLAGNVIKYVSRFRHKGTPLKDLQKARAYIDRLIRDVEQSSGKYGD
jgi:hypothetical protein